MKAPVFIAEEGGGEKEDKKNWRTPNPKMMAD